MAVMIAEQQRQQRVVVELQGDGLAVRRGGWDGAGSTAMWVKRRLSPWLQGCRTRELVWAAAIRTGASVPISLAGPVSMHRLQDRASGRRSGRDGGRAR